MTIWDWVSSILWKIDLEEFKLNFTIIKKSNGAKKKKKKDFANTCTIDQY